MTKTTGTFLCPGIYRVKSWKHHGGHDWLLCLTRPGELTNVVPMRRVNRRVGAARYNNGAGRWMIMIDGVNFGLYTTGKFGFTPIEGKNEISHIH